MSNNPIGSAVTSLSGAFTANKSLKRLSIQSCALKDVSSLLDARTAHKTLQMLDMGQSYATEDLGMRYNWLSDSRMEYIVNLVE